MLNRFIKLTGIALFVASIVPAVQQARSGYMPDTSTSTPKPGLTGEISSPVPQATVPPVESPQGLSVNASLGEVASLGPQTALVPPQSSQAPPADANLANSTLAIAPQAEDVRVEIHLRHHEVLVYQGETITKRYPIGVGQSGWETPVGTFQVQQMRENPTWISPFTDERIPGGDARNPLGTRWIGFWTDGHNWIGFHGTRNPATVGRNASHGCIHMHRSDLEALYSQVKLGTSVTVKQ